MAKYSKRTRWAQTHRGAKPHFYRKVYQPARPWWVLLTAEDQTLNAKGIIYAVKLNEELDASRAKRANCSTDKDN